MRYAKSRTLREVRARRIKHLWAFSPIYSFYLDWFNGFSGVCRREATTAGLARLKACDTSRRSYE